MSECVFQTTSVQIEKPYLRKLNMLMHLLNHHIRVKGPCCVAGDMDVKELEAVDHFYNSSIDENRSHPLTFVGLVGI